MLTFFVILGLIHLGLAHELLMPSNEEPSGLSSLSLEEEDSKPLIGSGNNKDECTSGDSQPSGEASTSSGEIQEEQISSGDAMVSSSDPDSGSGNHPISAIYSIDIVLEWPANCWGLTYCYGRHFHASNHLGCYCDASCELYKDCCYDYDLFSLLPSISDYEFGCTNIRPQLPNTAPEAEDQYIKAIDSCTQSWLLSENGTQNANISILCSSNDGILPPVTDPSTGITYKNMFCAFCNGIRNTTLWGFQLKGSDNFTDAMNFTKAMNELDVVGFEPPLNTPMHRCFANHIIDTCPPYEQSGVSSYGKYSWLVIECDRYQRVVEANSTLYRNEHCAYCNGQRGKAKVYTTQDCLYIHYSHPVTIIIFPDDGTDTQDQICGDNEVFDPEKMMCREIFVGVPAHKPPICAHDEIFNSKIMICQKVLAPPDEISIILPIGSIHLPELITCKGKEVFDPEKKICKVSDDPIECVNGSLIALDEGEFEYAGNDWVYFNGGLLKVLLNSSEGLPVVCVNYSQNGSIETTTAVFKYPIGFDYLTYVGCFLSLVAYSMVLVTFCAFKELRTLSTKILMCISIASIGFNILTLSVVMGAGEHAKLCQAVAIGLHFFILTQFTWMTVMCIEMVYTFYLASRLRPVQKNASQERFYVYCAVSWTLPFLLVSGVTAVNYTSSELVQYGWNQETENQNCWINHFHSAIVVFIAPMLALALLQLLLYIIVAFLIYSSHAKKSNTTSTKSIPYFRILVGLFFASNIMWVFGFMAIWIGIEWAWYPFSILFSSQGLVIFLGFFGTKKVLKLYASIYTKIKGRYSSTFRSTKATSV